MDWTLGNIKASIRKLTGRPDTSQISDAEIGNYISDFYENVLPTLIQLPEIRGWLDFNTSAADTGEYDLTAVALGGPTLLYVFPPMMVDGVQINISMDPGSFWQGYPKGGTPSYAPSKPQDALLDGNTLYLRPIPDGVYEITAPILQAPVALANAGDQPIVNLWGKAIAHGAAIEIFKDNGQFEEAKNLDPYLQGYIIMIRRRDLQQLIALRVRAAPRF